MSARAGEQEMNHGDSHFCPQVPLLTGIFAHVKIINVLDVSHGGAWVDRSPYEINMDAYGNEHESSFVRA